MAEDSWILAGIAGPAVGVGAAFGLVAIVEALRIGTTGTPFMSIGALVVAIPALLLGLGVRTGTLRVAWVQGWIVGVAALAAVNGSLHIAISGEPRHTLDLALAVIGAGIFLLDFGWYALVVAAVFCAWLVVLPSGPLPDAWLHGGVTLAAASGLGALAVRARRRAFRFVTAMQREEAVRDVEIRSALDRAETARQGEEQARVAVESAVRQLKDSEERFRRLAEASFEGVVIHQQGRMVDANRRASEMFGYSPSDFLQRRVELLAAPESRDALEALLEADGHDDRGPRGIEVVGLRANGTRFPIELSVASVVHSGEPASVLVARDATARKQIEEMLRQIAEEAEESSRAKSAFLANMSHELRTPLNAVIGFSNVLRRNQEGVLGERERVFLDRIASNGRHLLTLINDVLDLSKIEAGRMELELESIELGPFLEDVVQSLELARATGRGPELRVVVPAGVQPLMADRQRLRQVLINLVGNALKFTEQGHVEVRVVAHDGTPARIEVEDTGIGIPEDRMAHIFSPFRQVDSSTSRRYGGTGLGLTISRSLCEMMGFRLEGRSVLGSGSTFSVLALAAEAPDRRAPASELRAG